MPPIPDEAHLRTPEETMLQRQGDPIEQRGMRSRMHDRQTMLTNLCRAHNHGDTVKRSKGIVEINGKIIVPVGKDLH